MHRQILPTISSSLIEMIASLEFMADRIAQLARILYERCSGNSELVTDLIRETTRQNFCESAKTTASVRNLSHFIVRVSNPSHPQTACSEQAPFALLRSLPLLLKLLDREAYTLRVGVIQALGNLIEKTGQSEQTGQPRESQRERRVSSYGSVTNKRASIVIRRQSLAAGEEKEEEEEKEEVIKAIDLKTAVSVIGLLEERQHDVNAFARSATLRVFASLVDHGFVPLSKYLAITRVAIERLQDKGVLVRKNAMNVAPLLLCDV